MPPPPPPPPPVISRTLEPARISTCRPEARMAHHRS
jgi:hypothetical protein